MATYKQDKYVLGQSSLTTINQNGQEVRLDLKLNKQVLNDSGKVKGTVTDTNVPPVTIPNALVKIMDSDNNPILHGISNSLGDYIIDNVPIGPGYNIYAIASGKLLKQGDSFAMSAKAVITRNFNLDVDPASQLGLIAGDIIASVGGAPINGAVVSLYKVVGAVETVVAINYSNEYGQFVFGSLEIGDYKIIVSALGYIPNTTTATISTSGQIVSVLISLVADEYASKGTVSGMVFDESITPNQPIADAEVVLYSVDSVGNLTAIARTTTNSNGVYLFFNVPQGNYKVKSTKTQDVTVS